MARTVALRNSRVKNCYVAFAFGPGSLSGALYFTFGAEGVEPLLPLSGLPSNALPQQDYFCDVTE